MKLKKVASLGLAVLMCGSTLASCGKKEEKIDTPEHLEIKMIEAGNGSAMIKEAAKRFEELNPGKTVEVVTTSTHDPAYSEVDWGPSLNTVDLYYTTGNYFTFVQKGQFTVDGQTYPCRYESLDDVYENPAFGETVAIKDKIQQDFVDYFYNDPETSYFMPAVGDWTGLVYNAKMFETYDWDVPLTTDHMIEVCDKILATTAKSTNANSKGKDIKISPFTFSRDDSYWYYVYNQWWAQYDGLEAYNLYYEGKDINGRYTADIHSSQGILNAMKVMETLLGTYYKDGDQVKAREKVYTDNALTFRTYTDIQSTFLYAEEARINPTGATTAAMMPNGAWLENEMSVNFAEEIASGKISFKTMKTPVISAITDKTSFKGDDNLRELIRWIDGGKVGEKPSFASDADVKIVEEARGIYRPQLGLVFLIPAYATAKDLAKDFLRFLYSNEGALIYASATQGINLPIVGLDYSSANISEFQKSKFEIINSPNARIMLEPGSSPMAISGGRLTAFETVEGARMEAVFSVSNPADFKPANEIFLAKYEYAVKNWNTYMKNAGLLD